MIEGHERAIKIDDLSLITKYHLVDNGSVREMTKAEKDALDLAETQAQEQAENEAIDRLEVKLHDVIVALVKRINVRIPSNPISKAEIISQIKADR